MMDVENFQSLSMAEKLKLWKLKTGRANNNNKTPATSYSFSAPTSRTKSPGTSIVSKAKSPKPENMKSKSPIPNVKPKDVASVESSVPSMIIQVEDKENNKNNINDHPGRRQGEQQNVKPKDVASVESSVPSMIIQVEDKENNKNNINTSPTLSEKAIAVDEPRETSGHPAERSVALNMVAVSPKETSQPSQKPQPKKEEEQGQDQQPSVSMKRRDTMALGAHMLASPLFAPDLSSPGNFHDYREVISLYT